MLSYGIINSVFFGIYGSTMKLLNADISGKTPPDYTKICLAGGLGGLCQLVPAVPIDVIKVVLQSQIPHGTTGTYNITQIPHGTTGTYNTTSYVQYDVVTYTSQNYCTIQQGPR
jgi:hypothetical protein